MSWTVRLSWEPEASRWRHCALGRTSCRLMAKVKGWRYRWPFVDNMAFGGYNKHFRPARTTRDWLTKDERIVDAYLADERCTFLFTLNGYYNLFHSIEEASKPENLQKMPMDLPVLFVSGAEDPWWEILEKA